jgi:16S rRNA G527 N7-methylase RsmG
MSRDQTAVFKSALDEAISSFGIESTTEAQRTQLVGHYSMLCRWNRRLNLTRITELAKRHASLCESLFGASFIAGEHAA